MRAKWDLMPPGALPDRFVAISSPALGESRLWSIDANPSLQNAGAAYLEDVRMDIGHEGGVPCAIAGRIVQYAGMDEPSPNLVYLSILALTQASGGRSVVIEVDGQDLSVRPLSGATYAEAMAEYDALSLDAAAGPAP